MFMKMIYLFIHLLCIYLWLDKTESGTSGHDDHDLSPEDEAEQDDQHQKDVNKQQWDDLHGNLLQIGTEWENILYLLGAPSDRDSLISPS